MGDKHIIGDVAVLQSVVYPLINLSPAAPLTPPTLLIVCVCVYVCTYSSVSCVPEEAGSTP